MKHFKLGLYALSMLLCIGSVKAQTVDEVVNKYLDALGGKEKLSTLKTVRMEGVMNTNNTDVNITVTKDNMVGQRIDIAVMGMNGYKIFTPLNGWNFMPFAGQKEPTPMKPEELNAMIPGLDIQGNLFNYKDKGHQLILVGKEKVDTADCFKIKATLKNGNTATYFIDAKTFYLVKTISTQFINGSSKEVTTGYSNFKPAANGFVFPFTTTNAQGQIDFTKIDVNLPIDPKVFTTVTN